jgi:hypothetical protein
MTRVKIERCAVPVQPLPSISLRGSGVMTRNNTQHATLKQSEKTPSYGYIFVASWQKGEKA